MSNIALFILVLLAELCGVAAFVAIFTEMKNKEE